MCVCQGFSYTSGDSIMVLGTLCPCEDLHTLRLKIQFGIRIRISHIIVLYNSFMPDTNTATLSVLIP